MQQPNRKVITMRHFQLFYIFIIFSFSLFASDQTVRIGILTTRPADIVVRQYSPTAAYLHSRIPAYNFEIVPLSYLDFDYAIKEHKINIVFTNPEHFIHLHARYGLIPVATIISLAEGHPVSSFGGVIFTRADNTHVNNIEDIKGKKIVSPIELAFGGYMTQKWELYKKGVYVDSETRVVFTGMPHDKAVKEVLSSRADVGFVRTGILESMAKEGRLKLSDIKIINKQVDSTFPQFLSTELFPEWPIAVVQEMSEKLSKDIGKALLELSPSSVAAIDGGFYGFAPPSDYSKIESLMIKLGAISAEKSFGVKDVLIKYVYFIMAALMLMLSIGVFVLYRLFTTNKSLKLAASKIENLAQHESNLLASLGEGVYGVDSQGICTFINDAALRLLGFDQDEVLGFDQHKVFHHKHPDGSHYHTAECPIAQTLKDGKIRQNNDYFVTKEGGFLPVSVIATPIMQDGAISGAVVSFQDITTQKKLLTELQNKELRWHMLFDNNAAGILIVDANRDIIDVNIQFCSLFGYEKSEIVGQNVVVIHIDEEHFRGWAPKFNSVRDASDIVSNAEYAFKKKNGEIIWLAMSGVKIALDNEAKGVVVWSCIDITERKEAEAELRRLNNGLESKVQDEVAKNREKDLLLMRQSRLVGMGEMVGNIAHQWRQPLNALAIRVQDMQLAYVLGEVDNEFVNDYKHESMKLINYMSQTIEDFRNFFKPDKQKELFSVLSSIEDAYSLTKDNLKIKSIHVGLFEYNDQFFGFGYKNEFAQVILNILANATDALMNKPVDDRSIMVDITSEVDFVKISICDNAGGIPEDIIDKIFDPYFTTKHKAQGTGLGLYMSKMIIERNMNGRICAYNTQNGACFEILVPIAPLE
jgi:PAS domain S-box-containing protein